MTITNRSHVWPFSHCEHTAFDVTEKCENNGNERSLPFSPCPLLLQFCKLISDDSEYLPVDILHSAHSIFIIETTAASHFQLKILSCLNEETYVRQSKWLEKPNIRRIVALTSDSANTDESVLAVSSLLPMHSTSVQE